MTKKILSMLLAVLMVVSMIPLTAAAADPDGPAGTADDPFPIGQTDVSGGWRIIQSGYYKLTGDITIPYMIGNAEAGTGFEVTLDMNGYSITSGTDWSLFYVDDTVQKLTIVNTYKGKKSVINNAGTWNTFDVSGDSCELTIGENVTVKRAASNLSASGYAIATDGVTGKPKIHLNGCTIEDTWVLGVNGTVTVPVEIKLEGATIKTDGIGLYQAGKADTSDVTVKNSSITVEGASGETGIEVRAGKLNLVNTTIKVDKNITYSSNENNNGSTSKGAAIAVAQHSTTLPIEVTLGENVVAEGPVALSIEDPNGTGATDKITVNVEGGKYTGVGDGSKALLVSDTAANVNISGGEFDGVVEIEDDSNVTITGGKYLDNGPIKEFIADTHYAKQDETKKLKYEVVAAKGLVGDPVEVDTDAHTATTEVTGTFTGANAEKEGNTAESTNSSVTIDATTGAEKAEDEATTTEVKIVAATAQSLCSFDKDNKPTSTAPAVTVETDKATVTLPSKAVELIAKQATTAKTQDVTIKVEETAVTDTDKTAGKYGEYEVTVKVGTTEVLSSGALATAEAEVEITITVDKPEVPAGKEVQAWYKEDGNLVEKLDCTESGDKLNITIGHLSTIELRVLGTDAVAMTAAGVEIENVAKFQEEVVKGGTLTFTLLKNIELTDGIKITSGSVTINGDGHTISVADDFKVGRDDQKAVFNVTSGNLTLNNVKVDAESKGRVVYFNGTTLEIGAKTVITGGKGIKAGDDADLTYTGGIYMNAGTLTVAKDATVTGNVNGGPTDDGYLEYAADLYVAGNVTANIKGGTIGNMFVAAAATANNVTVEAGEIETVFVDYNGNNKGVLAVKTGASINKLLVAMDGTVSNNLSERAIAQIAPVVAPKAANDGTATSLSVTPGEVPANQKATAIGQKAKDGGNKNNTDLKLTKPITINAGATLTIPADTKVDAATAAVITNSGALDVQGSLMNGTADDGNYVKFGADGTTYGVLYGENVDIDKSEGKVKIVTVEFRDGSSVVASFAKNIVKSGDTWAEAKVTAPKAPTKDGYMFIVWQLSDKSAVAAAEAEITIPTAAEDGSTIIYTALWQETQGGEPGPVDPPATGFPDVKPDAWYATAAKFMSEKEWMVGDTNGNFNPDRNLTRQDFAVILYAAAGKPDADLSVLNSFADNASVATYAKNAMAWAVSSINMKGDGTKLNPGQSVSREQVAVFLKSFAVYQVNYEVAPETALDAYPDKASVSSWATEAMQWAVTNGLIAGTASGTINPKGVATRAMAAQIIMKYATMNG